MTYEGPRMDHLYPTVEDVFYSLYSVQYRFNIPFYAGAVGAHEIAHPEVKFAK